MALRRKFGGKYYGFDAQFRLKVDADSYATRLRRRGAKARVNYFNERWIVWSRD